MKKAGIFIISCLLGSTLLAQQPGESAPMNFTLEDCIRYATENNNDLRTLQLSRASSEVSLKQSKFEYSPSLSASASQGYSYSHSELTGGSAWDGRYALSLALPLYSGGSLYNTVKQNKLKVSQADLQIEQARNALNLQIIQTFLSALMNQELLSFQETVVKTSEEQMKFGAEQLKVGSILESDYLLLESQYTSDFYNIENTRITIINNLNTLKNLLAIPANRELSIVYPDSATINALMYLPGLQEVVQQAFQYFPELRLSEKNIEIATLDVRLAKSGYIPTLDLTAGIGTSYKGDFTNFGNQLKNGLGEQVALSLNIPILNKNRVKSQVAQSKIRLSQAEIDKSQVELDLMTNIEQEYRNAQTALNKHKASEVKQKAYLSSYNAYNEQFKYGSITAVDLLQQQTNYLNALNEYLINKYSFVLNRKALDVYMGLPVSL